MAREENVFEEACREWVKGCSCSQKDTPDECQECTSVFLDYLKELSEFEQHVCDDKCCHCGGALKRTYKDTGAIISVECVQCHRYFLKKYPGRQSQDILNKQFLDEFHSLAEKYQINAEEIILREWVSSTMKSHREFMFQEMCRLVLEWWNDNRNHIGSKPDFVTIAKGSINRA